FPGETVGFPFRIANDSGHSVALRYCLEPEQPFRPASWQVQGPAIIGRGETARATLVVEVPRGAPARPGRYWLWLKAGPENSASSATGECVLVVERPPCLEVLQPPEAKLHPDGTLTVTLCLLKTRGDADLDLSLKTRHGDGWEFECSRPDVHLGSRVGPVDVDVTYRSPPGRSVATGDEIEVELRDGGRTLETYHLPVRTKARPTIRERLASKSRKRNFIVGGAIAFAALIAFLAIASSPDASPPSSAPDLSPAPSISGLRLPLSPRGRRDGASRPVVGQPSVAFHPASLDFRRVPEGGSVSREVTIFNRGDVELAIGGFHIEGASDFGMLPSNPCPRIASRATCALTIMFAPGAEGVRTATLIADHDGADRPARLWLTGIGARTGPLPRSG
ncbi:MAG: choice-of-anchor D domain-containing protein, partial [Actinomycetota bacterium]